MFARMSIIVVYLDFHFNFNHQIGIVWYYVVGWTLGRYCFSYYENKEYTHQHLA